MLMQEESNPFLLFQNIQKNYLNFARCVTVSLSGRKYTTVFNTDNFILKKNYFFSEAIKTTILRTTLTNKPLFVSGCKTTTFFDFTNYLLKIIWNKFCSQLNRHLQELPLTFKRTAKIHRSSSLTSIFWYLIQIKT